MIPTWRRCIGSFEYNRLIMDNWPGWEKDPGAVQPYFIGLPGQCQSRVRLVLSGNNKDGARYVTGVKKEYINPTKAPQVKEY